MKPKIKEIYLYAIHARNSGQLKVPVYIFPFEMTYQNMSNYKIEYKNYPDLVSFWENLKSGFDKFTDRRTELGISIDSNGDYVFR